jgi:hypothetical protein
MKVGQNVKNTKPVLSTIELKKNLKYKAAATVSYQEYKLAVI